MLRKPLVGEKVRLNCDGLRQIFGSAIGLSFMKEKVYTVTEVDEESLTAPEETWMMQVDDDELNMFLFDNWDFDSLTD